MVKGNTYTAKLKGFDIICKACGSSNVETGRQYWRDTEQRCLEADTVIVCKECGYKEKI